MGGYAGVRMGGWVGEFVGAAFQARHAKHADDTDEAAFVGLPRSPKTIRRAANSHSIHSAR
jgi:hypothetical protein